MDTLHGTRALEVCCVFAGGGAHAVCDGFLLPHRGPAGSDCLVLFSLSDIQYLLAIQS